MRRRLFILGLIGLTLGFAVPEATAAKPSRTASTYKLLPQRPGETDIYILSFGLWGSQSVFESEARGAALILEAQLDAKGRSIVRANTKRRSDATPEGLFRAAQSVAGVLDPDEDIAVLVLTSHGAPEGIGLVAGRTSGIMTPKVVGTLLDATGARHRILIVSACYSGTFANTLADERRW